MSIFKNMEQFVGDGHEFDNTRLKQPLGSNWCVSTCLDIICGYFLNKLSELKGYKGLNIKNSVFVQNGVLCEFPFPENYPQGTVSSTINVLDQGNNCQKYLMAIGDPKYFYEPLDVSAQYFKNTLNSWFSKYLKIYNLFYESDFTVNYIVGEMFELIKMHLNGSVEYNKKYENVIRAVLVGIYVRQSRWDSGKNKFRKISSAHQILVCGLSKRRTKFNMYDPYIAYDTKFDGRVNVVKAPFAIIIRQINKTLLDTLTDYYASVVPDFLSVGLRDSQVVEFRVPPLNELVERKI